MNRDTSVFEDGCDAPRRVSPAPNLASDRTASRYRRDIDGLRGIAVLSVVAYHYWGTFFSGGFIGVDVFFVISGYLLSEIIVSETEAGRFSFVRFYERRVRRIFPALFFMLLCSTIFAWFYLLPSDLVAYSRSVIAAALSASNFYLWKTSNYFDAPAAVTPLLHTWSLAVEEQFYLLFPVFIVVLHRQFRKHFALAIAVVAALSFTWSVIDVRLDPSAAFFLPFTRAWELLIGALLAIRVFPFCLSRVARECLAALGAVSLVFGVLKFTQNTPFPGAFALVPCLGSAAIILAGQQGTSLVGRLLSRPSIVFVGLISYSLYLWHWPLLVFSKISMASPPGVSTLGFLLLLFLCSFLIAAASWKFVETPFRKGPNAPSRAVLFRFAAVCLAFSVGTGSAIVAAHGLNGRFPVAALNMSRYIEYASFHPEEFDLIFRPGCFLDRREPISHFDEHRCLDPVPGKQQVLIFGDSRAANLQYGLENAYPHIHFLEATSSACPPILGDNAGSTSECKQLVNKVMSQFIPGSSIKAVLLQADWNTSQLPALMETIDSLRHDRVQVVLLGPAPSYGQALPRLLARALLDGQAHPIRFAPDPGLESLDHRMGELAGQRRVQYVSLLSILCPAGHCLTYAAPSVPMQFDQSHLTLQGSRFVGDEIHTQFPSLFD